MRFWTTAVGVYGACLLALLGLPFFAVRNPQLPFAVQSVLYGIAVFCVLAGTLTACLLVARPLFPHFWWMAQVLRQDVYEMDGVYFIGLRLTRVPARLQRLLFGADERMRRWDLAFGLAFLVLLMPHSLAALTSFERAHGSQEVAIVFPESMHRAVLSALPLMREQSLVWNARPELASRLAEESRHLQAKSQKTDAEWYRLAQLLLVRAFRARHGFSEPYAFAPADRLYFDRGMGAQATAILNELLSKGRGEGEGLRTDAATLLGFFHLSDGNYAKAQPLLQQALRAARAGRVGEISGPMVALLAAQNLTLLGQPAAAQTLLEGLLADASVTGPAQALVLEHLAEAQRAQGRLQPAQELLQKAQALYEQQSDGAGLARVHVRRAALLLDRHQPVEASRELSQASSAAESQDDLFTLNMVERLAHRVPAAG